VRLLFIGESPPASGRFFYRADSGLYRAMRDAFRAVDASISDDNFLAVFKEAGCYFVDLCSQPVDDLSPKPRRAICESNEVKLAGTIARLKPLTMATVVRSIESIAVRAAVRAGWSGEFLHLPYPGRWPHHKDVFINTLASHLAMPPSTCFLPEEAFPHATRPSLAGPPNPLLAGPR
jgi:hypothetical protein